MPKNILLSKNVLYFLPAVIWMILIFMVSNRERIMLTGEGTFDFLMYKSAHVTEYAMLTFLYIVGLVANLPKISKVNAIIIAACCALFYACTDEFHQTFIPTREGKFFDVGIDTIGIAISVCFTHITGFTMVKKYLRKKRAI